MRHPAIAQVATYTTQGTNIQALRGNRTHDTSNQAAADLRLRPQGMSCAQFEVVTLTEAPSIFNVVISN
jgi:hypothetical protein